MKSYPITIESAQADNGPAILKLSLVILFLNWCSHWFWLDDMTIANMFVYGLVIAGLLLGGLKSSEPRHVLTLSLDGLDFHHRYGTIQIAWRNVQRIDLPKVDHGLEKLTLDFIGIKMKNSDEFFENVPLRLVSKLLTEQRPLWLLVARRSCQTGECVGEDFIDAIECQSSSGRDYKGLIAMFVYRYEKLAQLLGFHLYIPLEAMAIETSNLLNLLKEVKNEADSRDFTG